MSCAGLAGKSNTFNIMIVNASEYMKDHTFELQKKNMKACLIITVIYTEKLRVFGLAYCKHFSFIF